MQVLDSDNDDDDDNDDDCDDIDGFYNFNVRISISNHLWISPPTTVNYFLDNILYF